jgi:hypothetical protein
VDLKEDTNVSDERTASIFRAEVISEDEGSNFFRSTSPFQSRGYKKYYTCVTIQSLSRLFEESFRTAPFVCSYSCHLGSGRFIEIPESHGCEYKENSSEMLHRVV